MSITALLGGLVLGTASALLLLTHGRIAGISGITAGAWTSSGVDRRWRVAFLFGLVASGLLARMFSTSAVGDSASSPVVMIVAGLLVGIGARLGNGCTSGHGICGLARAAPRSLTAVVVFMMVAAITATIVGRMS